MDELRGWLRSPSAGRARTIHHPLRTRGIEQHAPACGALHRLWAQRGDVAASELGEYGGRVDAVPSRCAGNEPEPIMAEKAASHSDDTFDFIARYLAHKLGVAPAGSRSSVSAQCAEYFDVQLGSLAGAFLQVRHGATRNPMATAADTSVFYDAAWELCRIGVLRPGPKYDPTVISHLPQDGYSVTAHGREWLKAISDRPVHDPSRFSEVLRSLGGRFGEGFLQRSEEAARCYRGANYLACCTMAGAAAESILLATAIAKVKDAERVMAEYRSASGRSKVTKHIIGAATNALKEQFMSLSGLINYWRDESAHGVHSSIGETQAYTSVAQLIRFAQLVSDHWGELTL